MALVLSNELRQLDLNNCYQENMSLNLSGILDALNEMPPTPQPLQQPYVEIIEQPAPKEHRFRYKREIRSLGTIPGVNSTTTDNKTYPTIKIRNYVGAAEILVSCITKELPYLPHPHKLMGKSRDDKGYICITCDVKPDENEFQIKAGVECVKINEVADSLRARQRLCIDPFNTGFPHIASERRKEIELNAVRLCFQVFIEDNNGRCRRPLPPIVSDIVYDKKAFSELHIAMCAPSSGTITGGTLVILLCEKITTNDVVEFYLKENGIVIWRQPAATTFIHKQVAVGVITPAFTHPSYTDMTRHVTVQVQLRKLSDKSVSNSMQFEYIPVAADVKIKQKIVADLLQVYHDGTATDQKLEPASYGDWQASSQNTPVAQPGPSRYQFPGEIRGTPSYIQSPAVSVAGSSPMSCYGGQNSPLRDVVLNYAPSIPQYVEPLSNLEHIPPHLMQNVQESSQAGAMETDGNSSASLSNLQLSSGDIPMLSSGELNQYKEI